ncbi:UDP-N-acetylglucosamine transferase subunit ALG13 homolog [Drosophila guanche]|uniref:UDP-N-acetylglucosamine transferase subunit ALG13 n=1 Tax=Drosophila guanche TaxID=7266 RepID=A0A3B0KAK1_DROGU|nr:UDP-N-acetylglucosamine transferase subunit ALG13 homolog [Drosophila guanche]SPP80598.1 blast:UDP-N-acetylglucosamine transferase subunit ALG13 homolog [Drosophila guanche]
MHLKTVYVTVGTTKFDALIEAITSESVLKVLQSRECRKLILQHGNSEPKSAEESRLISEQYGIQLEQYTFRPNIEDIKAADLIIGHAGAGTCMDILTNGKVGLIVVNDELMDNHQQELAMQLTTERYLYTCKPRQLAVQLGSLDFESLRAYESADENMLKFVKALDELMVQRFTHSASK